MCRVALGIRLVELIRVARSSEQGCVSGSRTKNRPLVTIGTSDFSVERNMRTSAPRSFKDVLCLIVYGDTYANG